MTRTGNRVECTTTDEVRAKPDEVYWLIRFKEDGDWFYYTYSAWTVDRYFVESFHTAAAARRQLRRLPKGPPGLGAHVVKVSVYRKKK